MNARLLLALLTGKKALTDKAVPGFVMPIVVMVGLVLTVLGFSMIQLSSDQKQQVVSKNLTNQTGSVAEAGVTRVMDLMNEIDNRFIATLPDCNNFNTATDTCSDAADVPNWNNLDDTSVWSFAAGEQEVCQAIPPTNIADIEAIASSRNLQNLPKGEYRLGIRI